MKRVPLLLFLALAGCGGSGKRPVGDGIPLELLAVGGPSTGPITLPAITEKKLDNGLTILVAEDHELPLVWVEIYWPAGDVTDPVDRAGLDAMTAGLFRQGTRTKTAPEISEAIEFTGGTLGGGSDVEWTFLRMRVLSKDLDPMLALFADVALHPSFPGEEVDHARREAIATAKLNLDEPSAIAGMFAVPRVYGASSPFALQATEKSLAAITRDDVMHHARTVLGPDGAILAVGGDVSATAVVPRLESLFGGWRGSPRPETVYPPMPPPARSVLLVDKPGLTQTTIRIGLPGISRSHDDYEATELFNNVLGGSFSSRLTKVVRAEGGKTYGVSSWFATRKRQGAFWVSTSTRNAETTSTIKLVLSEVARMRDGGITKEELTRARANLAGAYARRFETGAYALGEVVNGRLLGLPLDDVTHARTKLAAVSLDDVNAAARRWLDVDKARIIVVGDASVVKAPLETAFGPVEVVHFLDEPTGKKP